LGLARGRVEEPRDQFRHLKEQYQEHLKSDGVRWDDCLLVAILHHHPLPLPDTRSGENLEPFHILENSSEFLRAACDTGIHLILHGHKHVSGMAEYRYIGAAGRGEGVCVSACGTSAKVESREREVCFFDVMRSGPVIIRRAGRRDTDDAFSIPENSSKPEEAIRHPDRRERRATDPGNWPLGQTRIKSVGSKTKVVRIVETGRGYVKITLDAITWSNDPTQPPTVCREFLHGGIGRVVGGWLRYTDRMGQDQSRQRRKIDLPSLGERDRSGMEGFYVDLPQPDGAAPHPGRFELKYILHNGYCLTSRQHLESFHLKEDEPCEETSTIEVLVPTESAELIVTFPTDCLPAEKDIRLEAWVPADGLPCQHLEITRGTYSIDQGETAYLAKQGAICYRP